MLAAEASYPESLLMSVRGCLAFCTDAGADDLRGGLAGVRPRIAGYQAEKEIF